MIQIGFEKALVQIAIELVIGLIPTSIIGSLNEPMKVYAISMRIYTPFTYLNIINYITIILGGYILLIKLELGIVGIYSLKILIELESFFGILYIIIKMGHKEALRLESFREAICVDFCNWYSVEWFKVFVGWYVMYCGSEGITVIVGFTGDTNLMAAWVSAFVIIILIWVFGSGLANKCRTDVAIKVGQGNGVFARKIALISLILSIFMSLIFGLTIIYFYKEFAYVFSHVPSVLE